MSQKKVKVRAKKHKRVVNTLTSPFERWFLPWMAARLPQWVMPDHLTALGMFAAVLPLLSPEKGLHVVAGLQTEDAEDGAHGEVPWWV